MPQTQPVTLRGDIETLCRQCGEIGYDALELHVRDPKRYDGKYIRQVADQHGLSVCAVANGMEATVSGLTLIDRNEERRRQAVDRVFEHVDFCAELNALLIVGIMRGNIPKDANRQQGINRLTASLTEICTYAASKGVDVVLESILRYINNYLCSIQETMDYIGSLNIPNLSLHIDTHSMAVEEQDIAQSIRYCGSKPLGYVHYSDNNRRYPGGGAVDFKSVTNALADISYHGYITAETLPYPTPVESARRALEYMKAIETIVKIERQNALV